MADLKQLSEALQNGNVDEVNKLISEALEAKLSPQRILNDGLIAGMDAVGAKFKDGEIFLPEVLLVAKAMQAGLDILKPGLAETGVTPVGKVVLGTVKGDMHDIGKNLVGIMLQGAGFEVHDLGIDVSPEQFLEAAGQDDVQLLAMSALISTTMPNMRRTIEALHKAGLTGRIKVLVGGAPLTQRYSDEIGADGYAPNAASAVDKARELIGI